MIGYYVHHQGVGHLHRALAVAAHLPGQVTVLSSLPPPPETDVPWVDLPRDDEPQPDASSEDVTAGGSLHWAPTRHKGLRERSLRVAQWVAEHDPDLIVSDVSVEMTLLGRLLSVPVAVVAMRGDRTDRVHALAYDAATRIIAPWPEETQHEWPSSWLGKTAWTGAVSRFERRPPEPGECDRPGRCVLVLLGRGGAQLDGGDRAAMAAVPDTHWHVAGPQDEWLDDPWPMLCRADVVVAAAGSNAVADVAAARRPLVAVPQPRPFDEQRHQVDVLAAAGLCVAAEPWPNAEWWPVLLDRAAELGGDVWSRFLDGRGASRMARALREAGWAGA